MRLAILLASATMFLVAGACGSDRVDDLFGGSGGMGGTEGRDPSTGATTSSAKSGSAASSKASGQASGQSSGQASSTHATSVQATTSSPSTAVDGSTITSAATGGVGEICLNGIDDDFDGQIDCVDPECLTSFECLSGEDCDNGIDDDANGLVDCLDLICLLVDPACM